MVEVYSDLAEAKEISNFEWADSWFYQSPPASVWDVSKSGGICGLPGCVETTEENAHLIAAAPDLLEALEKCIYIIGHPKDEPETLWRTDDEINNAYMQARAAIAKAKGGQP
jgi:hypothetical protein